MNVFKSKITELESTTKTNQNNTFYKFGLNSNGRINKFEYSTDGGFPGIDLPSIILEFVQNPESKNYQKGLYKQDTRVFDGSNELEPGTKKYTENQAKAVAHTIRSVYHILEALEVTKEEITKFIDENNFNHFNEWAQEVVKLKPRNFREIPVDIFLEWQYFLKKGKDKTYLQIPLNLKGGKFITSHIKGIWKEIIDEHGLKYVNENGETHPFERSKFFMDSPKGKQQFNEEESSTVGDETNVTW